ncbi:MAG TPA: delta-60 repeat domain-containing protein, partial [Verrucomicrobiae bacterium]
MNNKTATGHFLAVLSLLVLTTSHVFAGPGAWDQTYAPVVTSGAVYAMGLQTDGKLVVGGAFYSVNSSSSRYHLARLLSDGSLDSTFFATGSGVNGTVWSLAVQTDGHIVIGGDFTSVGGTSRYHVARLNANGTVDGSFLPTNTINYSVLAVAVQTNNAVIIGGSFSQGTFPSYNARLNADGSTDTSFCSYPNGAVYAIAIQTDGKIVIGGAFTTVNGANRYHIARLNTDGSLDNAFQNGLTGASSNVRCIQIQSDGKILIGGDFTTVNGSYRNYVARLSTDGSIDNGFNYSSAGTMGANGPVYSLAVQPDNNIVIGG